MGFFRTLNRWPKRRTPWVARSKASALPTPVAGFSTSCDASGPFQNNIEVSFFPTTPANVSGSTFGNGVTLRAGVTFVPISNNPVTDITFRVDGPGGGFDQCQVDIYATSGGLPTGSSLGTSNSFQFSITAEYKKFTFATPVAVTSGVTYAAVLSRTGAQNGSNAYDIGIVGSGGTNLMLSENASHVWSTAAGSYPLFWVGTSAYTYWAIGRDATTATTLKAIGAVDPSKSWPTAVYKTGFATSIATIFTRQYRDILHIVISDGATNYKYQTFDMKTGTFVTAETIFSGLTIVTSAQASIVVRQELPAGEVVVHFNGTAVSSHARTYYSRRTAVNTWSAAVQIDPGSPSTTDFNNQSSVLGQSDRVHFLYTDNTTGAGYHRSLDNGNTFDTNSSQTTVQPNGVQPVAYRTGAATVKVQNSNQAAAIAEMHFDSGANPAIGVQTVTQTGRTPSSPHRTFVDIDDVNYTYYASYILYVDSVNNDVYAAVSTDHGLNWSSTATLIYTGTVSTGGLNFCIGSVPYVRGGNVVIPMIFVEGGAHKYYEYTLRSAAVAKKIDATTAGSYSLTAPVATLLRHGWVMGATAPASYSLTAPVATLLRHGWKQVATTAGSYALTGSATTLLRHGWSVGSPTVAGSYTLTGQTVTLRKGKVLAAGVASYTLTGSNVPLGLGLTASAGSYALTGAATTKVLHGWRMVAAGNGIYVVTGSNVSLRQTLTATTAGSYALTGQTVGLKHGYNLTTSTPASYALTGTAATLRRGSVLTAGVASYALTGASTTLLWHGWKINAQTAGAYSLLGTNVKLSQALTASASSYTLTGTPATLRRTYRFDVTTAGSYVLTGTAARLAHGWVVNAQTAGSYALTGQPVGLSKPTAKSIVAVPGVYTLTGTDVGFKRTYVLAATAGSYALTGTAALLRKGYVATAGVGSYTLTGQTVTLRHGWVLNVTSPGNYALTGAATTKVLHGWKVAAGVASYALTGQPATLTYRRLINATVAGSYALTGAATTKLTKGKVLAAGVASYALTGQPVNFIKGKVLAAGVASYTLTGQTVKLSQALTASAGSYALTGAATTKVLHGWRVAAGVASYALTGSPAGVLHGWKLNATTAGSYALTGQPVNLVRAAHNTVVADPGSYLLTGQPVNLLRQAHPTIVALAGSYILTGQAARLARARLIAANVNSYTLTGTLTTLRRTYKQVATTPGSYTVTGNAVSLARGRKLAALTASYLLTGQPVTMSSKKIIFPDLYLDPDQFFTHNIKYNQTLQPGLFSDPDQFFTHDIYLFYGDTEVMYVPQEIRTMTLDFEDRLLEVVSEEKTMEILGEDRTMYVPVQPRETDADRGMEVLDEETMMQAPVRRRA